MGTDTSSAALAAAVAARHAEIDSALLGLDQRELCEASRLPGWNRLNIVCHLRYGAAASRRMTEDALDTRLTAFYPLGREVQRPATIEPNEDESPADAVASLNQESQRLDNLWQDLNESRWECPVDEPDDNPDLGAITLRTLALLRLTEVEVHGYDLDLDLPPWSDTFVSAALPMRLRWLPSRRSNHRSANKSIDGSWAFANLDGPSFLVRALSDNVEVHEFVPGLHVDTTIVGTGHQLLAFILGRASLNSLEVRGDEKLAASFLAAFPAP